MGGANMPPPGNNRVKVGKNQQMEKWEFGRQLCCENIDISDN